MWRLATVVALIGQTEITDQSVKKSSSKRNKPILCPTFFPSESQVNSSRVIGIEIPLNWV
jgi:indole-3-glycerol phosphate synthase